MVLSTYDVYWLFNDKVWVTSIIMFFSFSEAPTVAFALSECFFISSYMFFDKYFPLNCHATKGENIDD